jgi:hypothetical protein
MSNNQQKFNLKHLPFSPVKNPLVDGFTVMAKRKQVRTGGSREMIDPKTGEVNQAVIVEEQELDEIHFVKVFTAGIRAAFNLSLTGSRVFQAILEVYQSEPMAGGFADSIYLHFFDGGLSGRKLEISDRTFRRGLVELLNNGFLFPRGENLYWVNPNLFFRGDRATFIRTYRRRVSAGDSVVRSELETLGQTRLVD